MTAPVKKDALEIYKMSLDAARNGQIDADQLEKFLNMQIMMEDRQAKVAYSTAMASFQSECPAIIKNKKVSYKSTNYNYAELDEIIETIRPHLGKNSLSFSFNINKQGPKEQELVTTIAHKDGHSVDSSYFFNPLSEGGAMNESQRMKSALTYAKRAGLEDALGLITANQDDDARRAVNKKSTTETILEFKEQLQIATDKKIEMDTGALLKILKIESLENLEEASEEDLKRVLPKLKQKVRDV